MSGNKDPGSDFAPMMAPGAAIAAYSTTYVAPFIQSGKVKEATLKIIEDNMMAVGTAVMTLKIYELIP